VPKPRPGVFRITKNIHNILQGVSHPDQRVTAEEKQAIIDWITENASRYWFSEGGPLCSPQDGGADVVIVSLQLPIGFMMIGTDTARLMTRKCPDSSP
jgi:alpha,alpha-trehalose phosphorylase (configuration-retaining)